MPNPVGESNETTKNIAPPVGSIIAWHPRAFSSTGNVGVDSADQVQLGECWELADGGPLPVDSPLRNGTFNRKPDLTDGRFLMGAITVTNFLGDQNIIFGGTNHAGPAPGHSNNGNNSLTLSVQSLPPHVHGPGTLNVPASANVLTGNDSPDHTHSIPLYNNTSYDPNDRVQHADPFGGLWGIASTSGASNRHTHQVVIPSTAFAGSTSNGGFANNAISILPQYLAVKFIMRVK